MLKLFCDRCGAKVNDTGEGVNELHFTSERKTPYGYDNRLNLCNKCLRLFWAWIKECRKKNMKKAGRG